MKIMSMRWKTAGIVFIALLVGAVSCSTGGGQRSGSNIVLSGTILYPDMTIVDDRIVNVKLNPGPDTLRVRNGHFSIYAPYQGEYQLLMSYPQRMAFPPLTVSLERGTTRLSFMIPREERIESLPADREEERAGQDTRIIIIRP